MTTYKAPTLTITSPTEVSAWNAGSSYNIQWTKTYTTNDVDIWYGKGGSYIDSIVTGTANDGSHTWDVPTGLTPGTDYWIFIKESNDTAFDYSRNFEITSQSITVTSPTSSSSWAAGSTQTVTWTSTGTITSVDIGYWKGSDLLGLVVVGTGNDGSHSWTIPSNLTAGTDYFISVSDSSDTSTMGVSDDFTITAPLYSITVTVPDGSTSWTGGTIRTITWTSTGTITSVDIWLYKGLGDTGEALGYIALDAPNTGSYEWGIPISVASGTDYWIEIVDADNEDTYDFSVLFELVAHVVDPDNPSILITAPTSVSAWRAGSLHTITWTSAEDLSTVSISLYKGGTRVRELASSIDGMGNYEWSIPGDTPLGTDYQIKVVDNSNSDIWGTSDEFEIAEASGTGTSTTDTLPTIPSPGFELVFVVPGLFILVILLKRRKQI